MDTGTEQERAARIDTPRLMILGSRLGAGVTTAVIGLVVALRKAKASVAVAKIGADLIQATHYRRITGRLSYSLDPWLLTQKQLLANLARFSSGAELVIIEGQRGIFDDWESDSAVPTEADLAELFGSPIVLVVDAQGYGSSIAAVVGGFCEYARPNRIAGVICNRVDNEAHSNALRKAIEALDGPRYLGGIDQAAESLTGWDEEQNPGLLTRSKFIGVGELIERCVDLAALRRIAEMSQVLTADPAVISSKPRECRIAVADDMAFHVTFQSNLELLRRGGAELVAFSPLVDSKLPPDTQGVYLPGGYMHLYVQDLAANQPMLHTMKEFARQGGAIYAEGSSVGYLFRTVIPLSGPKVEMCSVFAGSATLLSDRRIDVGPDAYVQVSTLGPSLLGGAKQRCRGLRDYRWALRFEDRVRNVFEIREKEMLEKGVGEDNPPILEGFSTTPNVLATAVHLDWASHPAMAAHLVQAARAHKQ